VIEIVNKPASFAGKAVSEAVSERIFVPNKVAIKKVYKNRASFRSSVRGVGFIGFRCERIENGLVRSVRLGILGVLSGVVGGCFGASTFFGQFKGQPKKSRTI